MEGELSRVHARAISLPFLWYACLPCVPPTRCHFLQASRQAAITAVGAALSAHRATRAALPLLVVADDNMQYRSMRYEVRGITRIPDGRTAFKSTSQPEPHMQTVARTRLKDLQLTVGPNAHGKADSTLRRKCPCMVGAHSPTTSGASCHAPL